MIVANDFLASILSDKEFVESFWVIAERFNYSTEREYQRLLVSMIRKSNPKTFTKLVSDIPTATNSVGHDIILYTEGLTYFIEAKKIENAKLRPSQDSLLQEIFGFPFLQYRIIVFDSMGKKIHYFTTLGSFTKFLKHPKGCYSYR